jgi:hypothetical protein
VHCTVCVCVYLYIRTYIHGIPAFENEVRRQTFAIRMDGVCKQFRILHNDELRDLYMSPSVLRRL